MNAGQVYAAANAIYIAAAIVAAVCTFAIYFSAKQVVADEQAELTLYKAVVEEKVAAAYGEGVSAGRDAASAKLAASVADQKAAEANERAEAARLEITRLTQPRRVTKSQIDDLEALLNDAPRGLVQIDAGMANTEARRFAEDIRLMLRRLGYTVSDDPGITNESLFEYEVAGVYTFISSSTIITKHSAQLTAALVKTGLGRGFVIDERFTRQEMLIVVGPRF